MDMVPDYLNIIVAIVIFGIGFPSLILQYPSWLRRIRPRYSIFHGSYFLILVITAFIFIALLEYKFYPPPLPNFCANWLCNFVLLIIIFIFFFAGSFLSFLLSVYLYNKLNKEGFGFVGKSMIVVTLLITALFFVLFVGVQWWILGQLLYYYAWVIFGDFSIPFTNLKLISLRERYNDTSNILVFIAIVGTIILWVRFYYHQFPMVLERITNVGLCGMHANGLCIHYRILKQIKRLLSAEKDIEIAQVIEDLGAMGANAESEGDVIYVLKSIQKIANALDERHLDIPHERFKDYVREIGRSLSIALTNNNVNDIKPYILSVHVLKIILKSTKNKGEEVVSPKEEQDKDTKFRFYQCVYFCLKRLFLEDSKIASNHNNTKELSEARFAAAKYYGEIGTQLILKVKNTESIKVITDLVTHADRFFDDSPELLSDVLFQFGIIGLKEQRARVFTAIVDYLRMHCEKEGTSSSTCHAYWGLLARIAATNESAKVWVKNKELSQTESPLEEILEEIDAAWDYFWAIVGDFETADALQQLKEYLSPPTDDSSTPTSSW